MCLALSLSLSLSLSRYKYINIYIYIYYTIHIYIYMRRRMAPAYLPLRPAAALATACLQDKRVFTKCITYRLKERT